MKNGVCVDKCPTLVSENNGKAVYDPPQIDYKKGDYKYVSGSIHMRPTFTVMYYCVPDFTAGSKKIFKDVNQDNWGKMWDEFKNSSAGSGVYDLYLSSRAIYTCVFLAPVWAFIFIAIMSAFAEVIAWVCVALAQIGLIGGAVACFMYRSSSPNSIATVEGFFPFDLS